MIKSPGSSIGFGKDICSERAKIICLVVLSLRRALKIRVDLWTQVGVAPWYQMINPISFNIGWCSLTVPKLIPYDLFELWHLLISQISIGGHFEVKYGGPVTYSLYPCSHLNPSVGLVNNQKPQIGDAKGKHKHNYYKTDFHSLLMAAILISNISSRWNILVECNRYFVAENIILHAAIVIIVCLKSRVIAFVVFINCYLPLSRQCRKLRMILSNSLDRKRTI